MKKYLFYLAAGIMALTACTSEEITDVSETQGNAISFQNVINKSSRAEGAVEGDLTKESFELFLVYGYYTKENLSTPIQIFNGVPVKKVNGAWVYDGVRYWVPKCTYYFYAYSCADIALSSDKGSPTLTLTNESSVDGRALSIMNYLCDSRHQHDLVFAEAGPIVAREPDKESKEPANQAVSLPFKHALCKIKAVFTTDFPVGYNVRVSNVRIDEFYNKANFNARKKSWDGFKEESGAYTDLPVDVNKNVMTNAANSKVETGEIFMIPTQYPIDEWVKLHFTIELYKDIVKDGKVVGSDVVLQRNIYGTWSPNWEVGKKYTYNINITGTSAGIEPIVFAAAQSLDGDNSWDTSTSVDMTFGVDAGDNKDETAGNK